jgi:hypothetical protein
MKICGLDLFLMLVLASLFISNNESISISVPTGSQIMFGGTIWRSEKTNCFNTQTGSKGNILETYHVGN